MLVSNDRKPPTLSEKYQADIRTFAMRLASGVIVVNAVVVCLVFLVGYQFRHEREERAKVTARNLVHILEHDIANLLGKINVTLIAVADEMERQPEKDRLNRRRMDAFMSRQLAHVPELDNLQVTGANGDIICRAGVPRDDVINAAGHDFFTLRRNDPRNDFYLSRPVHGQLNNQWMILVARRVAPEHGSFRGVIWGAVPLDYFSTLFASQNIGPHSGISLRDADMAIIARYPAPKDVGSIIGNKVLSPELRKRREAGHTRGTFFTPGSWDNTAKIVSFSKIGPYPLFLNVGLATSDYLAGWQRDTARIAAMSLFYVLVTLLMARGLFVRYKREKLAEHASSESERRFHSMANTAPVMLWVVGADKQCVWVNNAWLDFSGKTLEEEVMNDWTVGIHPNDLLNSNKTFTEAFAARKPFRMEYRLRRADGQFRWVVDHGAPRYDDSGIFAGYIGSCLDISDSQQYQSQLKSLASELSLAQERERRRIAIDIHDYVVQDLAFARIRLSLMQRTAPSENVQTVSDIIDGTIGKLRNLIFDIGSSALYELGLVAALEDLGERLGKEHGFSFILSVHQELSPLVEKTKITLFQISRELLLNAAKHSRASRVTMAIGQDCHMIRLSVEDNGCGFDVTATALKAAATSSFGLFSIRQRLNHLGGTFEIYTTDKGGTCAKLAIPHLISAEATGEPYP